jgi:MFS family permease
MTDRWSWDPTITGTSYCAMSGKEGKRVGCDDMVDRGRGAKREIAQSGPPRSIVRYLQRTGSKDVPPYVKRLEKKKYSKTVRYMAANQAVFSYGNNVSVPFLSYYLIRIGAGPFQLGIMQSLSYLFQNGLQFPSAYLSDRLGRRIPFIVSGIGIASLILLLISFFHDIWMVIALIALLSAAMSIYFPSWSALLGDEITCTDRGRVLAGITEASIMAGLFGTVTAFLFIYVSPSKGASSFQAPFLAGALSFFIAILIISFMKESPMRSVTKPLQLRYVDGNYLYMVKIQGIFNFMMAISWPLFPLTITRSLDASNIEIGIITVITVLSAAAFQPFMGRLVDRVGPLPLIRTTRLVFIAVPFIYAFSTDIRQLFVWAIIDGIMVSLVNVSFVSYVLDSSPPETRAEYFAFYNLSLGIGMCGGTLLGGGLVAYMQTSMGFSEALFLVYMISGIGRAATVCLYFWLKKPNKRPSPPGQMVVATTELIRRLTRKP